MYVFTRFYKSEKHVSFNVFYFQINVFNIYAVCRSSSVGYVPIILYSCRVLDVLRVRSGVMKVSHGEFLRSLDASADIRRPTPSVQ